MNFHAQPEVRRTASWLLFLVVMSGPAFAGVSDNAEYRASNAFAVEDVALGMKTERVLQIYPTAKINPEVANCHRNGRAINVPEMTKRVIRHTVEKGDLTMRFDPPYAGGRLSRIYFDRSVELSSFDFRELLNRLIARYGGYERVLHRRKMEPAGRLAGYEWRGADGATLRVELRNDYRSEDNYLRLSFLARMAAAKHRPVPEFLSRICRKS